MHLSDLKHKSIIDLAADAAEHGIDGAHAHTMKRQELIFALLKSQSERGGDIEAEGVIEVLPDGFGFLRAPDHNYLPGADDIYVSPSQIRRFNLRTGDTVVGLIRPPKDTERYFALLRVNEINGGEPDAQRNKLLFDNLTPVYPNEAFVLEHDGDVSMRIIDLMCPLGKGQRCLIVSPPRAGKTVLLQHIARAIEANHPDAAVMMLLIDERPEEVTEMRRAIGGEVIASTFDEPASRHVQVAEIVIEKAKRLAESGKDVVILLDSITRLARAYNTIVPPSGKVLDGGVDAHALHKPKRFFGAARNLDGGGSLSIIATALVDTGSRMDEVIFEEFRGTGNAELHLDRTLMEQRIFPCLDVNKSGTRKEELLMTEDVLARVWDLRQSLNGHDAGDAMELLKGKLAKTKTNKELVSKLNGQST